MTFKEKFIRFMEKRYKGNDTCNRFLFYAALFFLFLGIVFQLTDLKSLSFFCDLVELFLLGYAIFRIFSKNVQARQKENRFCLSFKNKIKGFFSLRHAMWKSRKTHIFRKCPGCGVFLKLPKRKGTHTVKCQKCGKRFEVIIK